MKAEHDRVDDKDLRDEIETALNEADSAEVINVETKTWKDYPPDPLNLPTAQRKFTGSPSQVLDNLQWLYNEGYTTYPRTENQQYGDDVDVDRIVTALDNHSPFSTPVSSPYDPTEGSEFDPAHPPIVPTTNVPYLNDLDKWQKKMYIRVAKHFLATLMGPATRERRRYTFDVSGHEFTTDRYRITTSGYFQVYGAYKQTYDDDFPTLVEGATVEIDNWDIIEKETSPPSKWTSSSIVQEMEELNLGTSATRGSMIEKVQNRGYVGQDNGLESTELGDIIVESLEEHAPLVTDPGFTAEMQDLLDDLNEGDRTYEEVVDTVEDRVTRACEQISEHEQEIGFSMATIEDGCKECDSDLRLRKSEHGLFYGCESYPDCEFTTEL